MQLNHEEYNWRKEEWMEKSKLEGRKWRKEKNEGVEENVCIVRASVLEKKSDQLMMNCQK